MTGLSGVSNKMREEDVRLTQRTTTSKFLEGIKGKPRRSRRASADAARRVKKRLWLVEEKKREDIKSGRSIKLVGRGQA